jgi:hypothetical protein
MDAILRELPAASAGGGGGADRVAASEAQGQGQALGTAQTSPVCDAQVRSPGHAWCVVQRGEVGACGRGQSAWQEVAGEAAARRLLRGAGAAGPPSVRLSALWMLQAQRQTLLPHALAST